MRAAPHAQSPISQANRGVAALQALVYHGNKDIRLEDWPEPEPGPGEVKVQVTYCGICATDIEEWQFGPLYVQHGTPNPLTGRMAPIVMGHEIAGRVAKRGPDVESLEAGDRVAVQDVMSCGECFWCRRGEPSSCPHQGITGFSADGGLAEYLTWPADLCVKLPDHVADEEAALVEPASVATHAVRRSGVRLGDRVAVLGVGTVGLLTLQTLKAVGATAYAIDLKAPNLRLATAVGADAAIDASVDDPGPRLLDLTGGIGPDMVFEVSGAAEAPVHAVQWVRPRGRAVLVGIYPDKPRFSFHDIVGGEKEVVGSVSLEGRDVREAVRLLSEGKLQVRDLISDVIPLSRVIEDGFERMLAPEKDLFRILIRPGM